MSILEQKFTWRRPEAERRHRPEVLTQDQREYVRIALRYLSMRLGRGELAKRIRARRSLTRAGQ